jgi:hypothetical protein
MNAPNQPDGANRRQPSSFRERVGEAGAAGSTAAVAHLERWAYLERLVKFKVEYVGKSETSSYLFARRLEPGDFSVSGSSRLGGVPIRPSISSPRALKPDGSPDLDVFAFILAESQDAERFSVGQTVELQT